jgi:hypothetical protein
MVIVPGVSVAVDGRAGTARVEVTLPSRECPLAFSVSRAPHGRGWNVVEPLGGAFAWCESFDAALEIAVAAANGALRDEGRSSLP